MIVIAESFVFILSSKGLDRRILHLPPSSKGNIKNSEDGKVEENLDSLKGCFLIKPFRVPNTLKKGQKVWNLKRLKGF